MDRISEKERLLMACGAIGKVIASDTAHGFPSAQLAVMKDGDLVFSGAWGAKNAYAPDGTLMPDPQPSSTDTLYDLASNTKMYSVIYALQYLCSRGMADIDTPIVQILGSRFADDTAAVLPMGGIDSLDDMKRAKAALTIRDVICHRAGFPSDPPYHCKTYDLAADRHDAAVKNPLFAGNDGSDASRIRTLEQICRTPLIFRPGTKALYSDVDYMLMTYVTEALAGERLDVFLRKTFWEPMGLKHMTYDPLTNGFSKEMCAATELNGNTRDHAVSFEGIRGYTLQGEVHDEKAWYCMGGISGHAGLFSNAEDLARLADLMMTGTDGRQRYFSEQVIERFASPDRFDEWGLGWWRQGEGKRTRYFSELAPCTVIGHQGWTGTLSMIDRENRLVMVLLTNKINSPVTDPSADPNAFSGSRYTTASLGFASKLLYTALRCKTAAETEKALRTAVNGLGELMRHQLDLAEGRERIPSEKALTAILSAYKEQA